MPGAGCTNKTSDLAIVGWYLEETPLTPYIRPTCVLANGHNTFASTVLNIVQVARSPTGGMSGSRRTSHGVAPKLHNPAACHANETLRLMRHCTQANITGYALAHGTLRQGPLRVAEEQMSMVANLDCQNLRLGRHTTTSTNIYMFLVGILRCCQWPAAESSQGKCFG
jgi:hypothetical protein